jgi:probable F420-dependent oxidoreductase
MMRTSMNVGITLAMLNMRAWRDAAVEADRLGFESVWIPEHLVFPVEMRGSPNAGEEHPPVPPQTPIYEPFAFLSFLAGQTRRIRLGTNVYLLGLRHPFVAARAIATLDVVSGGRAEVGVGAGWLREEWIAAGLDPRTRGARLDEALGICKRLWRERSVEHKGEFYEFPAVMFEPKPVQQPHPPLLVGGESDAALRRAARHADGWYGLGHTPEGVGETLARVRRALAAEGRSAGDFALTVGGGIGSRDDLRRWQDAGVTRVVCTPWRRTSEALEALRRLAEVAL